MKREEWLQVDPIAFKISPGIEYEISSLGNVRRVVENYDGRGPFKKNKVLNLSRGDEYLKAKMSTTVGLQRIAVAHLVAHHFIGPRPDGLVINHIDGNKLNNIMSNLEYVTRSENTRHGVRVMGAFSGPKNGWRTKGIGPHLCHIGENSHKAKLTVQAVREIRMLRGKLSVINIAKMYGVERGTIYGVLNGKFWRHVIE
jgi:hypothetical protein